MSDLLGVLGPVILLPFVLLTVMYWLIRRENARLHRSLQRWVKDHGYTMASKRRVWTRWFRKGPYQYSHDRYVVFRITIIDEQGQKRRGWARCGSKIIGPASPDEAEGVLD